MKRRLRTSWLIGLTAGLVLMIAVLLIAVIFDAVSKRSRKLIVNQ